jgi:AP endonuclease-1
MSVQPVGRLVPGELNEDVVERFQETYKQSKLVYALPHGSCLINLGNPDPVKRECFYQLFLNGLQRCKQLSLNLYTFQ